MEAIKTTYSPNLVPISSPDIKIAVDIPETEEIAFTLVTHKKHKEKGTVSSLPSIFFFNSRSKILLIL